jgi:hypothetical protein
VLKSHWQESYFARTLHAHGISNSTILDPQRATSQKRASDQDKLAHVVRVFAIVDEASIPGKVFQQTPHFVAATVA